MISNSMINLIFLIFGNSQLSNSNLLQESTLSQLGNNANVHIVDCLETVCIVLQNYQDKIKEGNIDSLIEKFEEKVN